MNCEVCATPLVGRQRRFCSHRCIGRLRAQQRAAEYANRERVYRDCAQCGQRFEVVRNRLTYCSRKCANPNIAQARAFKRPSLFGDAEAWVIIYLMGVMCLFAWCATRYSCLVPTKMKGAFWGVSAQPTNRSETSTLAKSVWRTIARRIPTTTTVQFASSADVSTSKPRNVMPPGWVFLLASLVFVASGVSMMITMYQSYKRRRQHQ